MATDLFELETADYLLEVDYISRYVQTTQMHKTTKSTEIIKALKENFARHGIPEELRSDNGPQYTSAEFTHFAREWGFKHVTSSPRYPQSNGEVERAVQIVKSILKKEGSSQGTTGTQIHSTGMRLLSIRVAHGKEDQNIDPSFPYTVNTEVARHGKATSDRG